MKKVREQSYKRAQMWQAKLRLIDDPVKATNMEFWLRRLGYQVGRNGNTLEYNVVANLPLTNKKIVNGRLVEVKPVVLERFETTG